MHRWWLLLPLAVTAWALVHASGVHATVAGVVLGFTVPVLGRLGHPTAELFEHAVRPMSAGFAVPVFAFFAAGVTVGGWSGLGDSLLRPVTDGVIAGLVIGKPLGVFLTAFLLARFTHASLDDDLAWRDVLGVSLLAGIGFTVSLLIGELAFGHGTAGGRRRQDRRACRVCYRRCTGICGVVEPKRGVSAHLRDRDRRH